MSTLPPFELIRPAGLDEALEGLDWDRIPYAGGTELFLAMRAGLLRPTAIVDLKRLPELAAVEEREGALVIGGSASHRAVSRSATTTSRLPALADALERVGNPRVRSAGTLGGNLCFAEPKSDVATLLLALGADLELRSAEGARTLALSEFLIGPYTSAREPNELLVSISVPLVPNRRVAYLKYQTMERPTVGVAAIEEPDGSRRVVVGAVGGRPETFEIDSDARDPDEIASRVEVIPDMTGDKPYKRHLTSVVISRVLARLGAAA